MRCEVVRCRRKGADMLHHSRATKSGMVWHPRRHSTDGVAVASCTFASSSQLAPQSNATLAFAGLSTGTFITTTINTSSQTPRVRRCGSSCVQSWCQGARRADLAPDQHRCTTNQCWSATMARRGYTESASDWSCDCALWLMPCFAEPRAHSLRLGDPTPGQRLRTRHQRSRNTILPSFPLILHWCVTPPCCRSQP